MPSSPGAIVWWRLRRNRPAWLAWCVLVALYSVALLAPFLAPYGESSGERTRPFEAPSRLAWAGGPAFRSMEKTGRDWRPSAAAPVRLGLFVRGDAYEFLPGLSFDRHLFGPVGDAGTARVYWMGADQFGRDVLSRVLYGGAGFAVGRVDRRGVEFHAGPVDRGWAGYRGGWTDALLMRGSEILMSIPALYLILALRTAFPASLPSTYTYLMIVLILSLVSWTGLGRIVRGMVLSLRTRDYVSAAEALGLSPLRILVRHLLPNTLSFAVVAATIAVPGYILGEVALSFLGVGIQEPAASWGNMLQQASGISTRRRPPGSSGRAWPSSSPCWPSTSWATACATRSIRGISMGEPLLSVTGLCVEFPAPDGGTRRILDDVSFDVGVGESLGIVGESGSGKTMAALSVMGLLPYPGRQAGGAIRWEGTRPLDRLGRGAAGAARGLDGHDLPGAAVEPQSGHDLWRPGDRGAAGPRGDVGRHGAAAGGELLDRVGIADPVRRAADYPHQLSGGMRQRVMIAMALALSPRLLIADEPTTALDVTIQAQILDLLAKLCAEEKLALLLITHNFGVVARLTQRVAVMNAGRVVEAAPTGQLLVAPREIYTKALLAAVPRLDGLRRATHVSARAGGAPMLDLEGVSRTFRLGRSGFLGKPRTLEAVRNVSLTVRRGETLGLVGESGSGKTTLGRMILRLIRPTGGRVMIDGVDIAGISDRALRPMRRRMQMVFQDPAGSLNPRLTVESALAEPLEVHGIATGRAARLRVGELLEQVGLPADAARRYPHQFSGGQRQRIGIARALALGPELLVLDEPVSALDVTVQAQILDLFVRLRKELDLTSVFIGHDLAVVRLVCDRVAVMYRGEIVESGDVETLYANPLHSYTRSLLAAVPRLSPGGAPPGDG
jgi:peptide/nickel transport system ATP-binding protein